MTRRSQALVVLVALWSLVSAANAAPLRYLLDQAASEVTFQVDFGNGRLNGKMPVATADISLDFDRPSASRINVALNVARARTNLPFATGAMKSDTVLDAGHYPQITFTSTALRAQGETAEVDGILTVRGVARPVTLIAQIFQQPGSAAGDLSSLSVHLNTQISRAEFGATGYPDMVGDEVRIQIVAEIDAGS
jgi:polyisoprenoid-binding protein YceI